MLTQVSCSDGLLSGFSPRDTFHIFNIFWLFPLLTEAVSNIISPVLSVVPGIWQKHNKYLLNALIMFLWLEFFFTMIIYTFNKYIFSKSTWLVFFPNQWHCKLEVITIRSHCQLNLGDCLPKGRTAQTSSGPASTHRAHILYHIPPAAEPKTVINLVIKPLSFH